MPALAWRRKLAVALILLAGVLAGLRTCSGTRRTPRGTSSAPTAPERTDEPVRGLAVAEVQTRAASTSACLKTLRMRLMIEIDFQGERSTADGDLLLDYFSKRGYSFFALAGAESGSLEQYADLRLNRAYTREDGGDWQLQDWDAGLYPLSALAGPGAVSRTRDLEPLKSCDDARVVETTYQGNAAYLIECERARRKTCKKPRSHVATSTRGTSRRSRRRLGSGRSSR